MNIEQFNEKFSESTLITKMTMPAQRIGSLYNESASHGARIVELKLHATVDENGDFREPTQAELAEVVIVRPEIAVIGLGGITVRHVAPNGVSFTAGDLLAAVEKTEQETRGRAEWFGGVDIHHVFFEGIDEKVPGVFVTHWGS